MSGSDLVRGLVFFIGALTVLAGIGGVLVGGEVAAAGLWLILSGGVLLVAAALERQRYRSEAAEKAMDPPGRGGGETPGQVDARFRPTDEVFVDPTTRQRMRVLLDGRTGERRYVAED